MVEGLGQVEQTGSGAVVLHPRLILRNRQRQSRERLKNTSADAVDFSKREGHPRSVPGGADLLRLHASLSEMCSVRSRVVVFQVGRKTFWFLFQKQNKPPSRATAGVFRQ